MGHFDLGFSSGDDAFILPMRHPGSKRTAATALHETAHRKLDGLSVFGTVVRFMQRAISLPGLAEGEKARLQVLVDSYLAASFLAQEGWATYYELLYYEMRPFADEASAIDARTSLPDDYQAALALYQRAGLALPPEYKWAEPMLLSAVAGAAMNPPILNCWEPEGWSAHADIYIGTELNQPNFRLQLIVGWFTRFGWGETFLVEARSFLQSLPGLDSPPSRGVLLQRISDLDVYQDAERVQKALNRLLAHWLSDEVPALSQQMELNADDVIPAWWGAAVEFAASKGAKWPRFDGADSSLASRVDSESVTYVFDSRFTDIQILPISFRTAVRALRNERGRFNLVLMDSFASIHRFEKHERAPRPGNLPRRPSTFDPEGKSRSSSRVNDGAHWYIDGYRIVTFDLSDGMDALQALSADRTSCTVARMQGGSQN